MKLKDAYSFGRKVMTKLDSILKGRDIILSTKVHLVKAMVFPVVMYGCEGWTVKKAECQRIDAFELWCWRRLLRVPWTARSQPVHPKGDQFWVFFGRNDAKAEIPVLWPPHEKSWLIEKDSDAGRNWGQEEKGMTEDEMARWHHQLNGRESEWTPGVGDGQGGLACCSSWGHEESDTTERLNWTELNATPSQNKEPQVRKECAQWNQVSWVQSSASWPHYGTLSKLLTGQEESPQVHFPKFQAMILGCIYITDDKKNI